MNRTHARRIGTSMLAVVAMSGCAGGEHSATHSDVIRSVQPAQGTVTHVGCGQSLSTTDVGVSIALTPGTAGRWNVLLHNRGTSAVEFSPAHMDLVAVDDRDRIISWGAAWAGLRYQSLAAGGEWSGAVTPTLTDCATRAGSTSGATLSRGTYRFRLVTDIKGVTVISAPVRVTVSASGTARPA